MPHGISVKKAAEDVRATAREHLYPVIERQLHFLNALTDERLAWQSTEGRQDYVDAFGDDLPAGEMHYRQGPSYEHAVRLSPRSMATLLTVLFGANLFGRQLAEQLHADRLEEVRRMMQGLHRNPPGESPAPT